MKANQLTVRLKVVDREKLDPLWESAKGEASFLSPNEVTAMSWDDVFAESRRYQRWYEYAKKLLEKSSCWDELEKLNRMEKIFGRE